MGVEVGRPVERVLQKSRWDWWFLGPEAVVVGKCGGGDGAGTERV